MPYRILILQSARDDTTRRREIHIANSPLLREHTFEHVYALEAVPLDETAPLPARVMQLQKSGLDEKALLTHLNERIEAFQPDILLVNSGVAFHNYRDQMLFVLQTLKAAHPRLRIGFQPRPFESDAPRLFFEYSEEMRELLEKVF